MRRSIEFWIIGSLTLLIVLCGLLIARTPAEGARGCLDREQAARTWPTKQLGVDDDGCFTYLRQGVKPAPDRPMVGADDIAGANAEAHVALDMMQRWPTNELTMTRFEPYREPEQPIMTAKNMWTAILSLVLFAAFLEVLFGGKWIKTTPKGPRSYPRR